MFIPKESFQKTQSPDVAGPLDFRIQWSEKDWGTQAIIRNCINGIYRPGTLSIKYEQKNSKKERWVCALAYTMEKVPIELGDNICGIDLGVTNAAYCAVNDGYQRLRIEGGEIEEFRCRVEARRKKFLQGRPYANPGSVGHGTKKRIEPVFKVEDKIANFRDTKNKQYAKSIVDFAVKNRCGCIQMENLTGISTDDKFLKRWTYYDLQQRIEQKADEFNILVKYINPRFTSQRCSKCGFINEENRPSQASFRCLSCGYETNADYNAAKNIATPCIEEIINRAKPKESE